MLKVHVKDGIITRIETDDAEEPQFRACARGRAYRQRVYAPDRLLYPMKRVGPRGEGRFEPVSWDEALETVAAEFRRVRDSYGPASIVFWASGGDLTTLHQGRLMHRLLCMFGGYTQTWGFISYEGGTFSAAATYGTLVGTAHTQDDLLNSRLIIMWGWDPATTIHSCNTSWYLAQAKERGARIVCVDPRYTDSAATFADQWISIRPGTDAAMLIAMAYVMIRDELHDQRFLDRHTVGFDRFRDYVMGAEDGQPKTPAWAQAITGVPAATLEALAREYATIKPAALIAGIAPGRTAYGEQYHRAAISLSAMTGNIGVPGGSAADRTWAGQYWGGDTPFIVRPKGRVPRPKNPVDEGAAPREDSIQARGPGNTLRTRVHVSKLPDAIIEGKAGGWPADIKLLYLINTNYLNQIPDVNRTVQAFKQLEFMVVQEQFMTPTAKFADIVLPVCTFLERNDFTSGGATPFFGLTHKAIQTLGASRSLLDIATALAQKMGVSDFNDRNEEEWLRSIVDGYAETFAIPAYDMLKQEGIHKVMSDEPYVAFRKEIEDPKHHPFPTPSGKIEIFSQQMAALDNLLLPPIPRYIPAWESSSDPLSQKYPLQLITTHFRRRAHTQFENIPWLRELQPQAILINSVDAGARGIKNGDLVRVFNDRGEVIIRARVTERIMAGVVDIPQGAWYQPDKNGVDHGGCANVLTRNKPSPAGAFPSNTTLVQVEKLA